MNSYRTGSSTGRRTVKSVANTLGYSRQYFYKHCQENLLALAKEKEIKQLLDRERKLLPRLGGRKLYHQIRENLASKDIKIGRDALFKLLKKHQMLILPRRKYVTTTMSKHWLRKYPNLIKGIEIKGKDHVWVSDITYIKTDEGNCYLNLITDVWSRKIVGYAMADNMETKQMKQAFLMALRQRDLTDMPLIHHSDRGLQYCSSEYTNIAKQNNVKISMTENGDPYENALAERMNRTLKEEFGLGKILASRNQAKLLVNEAVNLYNNFRPHLSLKMKTPQSVYKQNSPILANQGIS